MTLQIPFNENSSYRPGKALLAAINTALLLNRPLLLSGKPGTGKTECADFIAAELTRLYPAMFRLPNALRFNTKSVSQFTDLFYQYDAVGHFGDKQNTDKQHFFSLATLGQAIAATNSFDQTLKGIRNYREAVTGPVMPCGSVVLIDEIDKAPRDFPNDLLAELEKAPLKFRIKELNDSTIVQSSAYPVVVVITSNNEKGLPEAFLRRCIFHYIDPPAKPQLLEILQGKALFQNLSAEEQIGIGLAIDAFIHLRDQPLYKQPSTSELVDWITCLRHYGLLTPELKLWSQASAAYKERLEHTLSVLVKTLADLENAKTALSA